MVSFLMCLTLVLICLRQASTSREVVKTIQSPDGDIIDCIHARDQPAFDHPLLQNQKILENPAELLKKKEEGKQLWQVWNQNDTTCPDQTVPIRRNKGKQFKKHSKKNWTDVALNRQAIPYLAEEGHEYAIGYTGYRPGIYGTQATLNLWAPAVEPGSGEFSLSQIWLTAGLYNESDLNTIEAGWQVYPDHYLDNQPRLFVYWTSDTYQNTGCYNLECPGFVLVPSIYTLGAAFAPISFYGGYQSDITISIWKDPDDGNWWLAIGQSRVGYWPWQLFTHLATGPATVVQWGGEITNTRTYGQHTTTHMGSGHFAEEGFGKASFVRNILILDYLFHIQPVPEFLLQTLNSTCYNAIKVHTVEWGTHFYFGGPGFNALCA